MNFEQVKDFLLSCDNAIILTHKSPDGDTLGSGFALCRVLRQLGKKAKVLCGDAFPPRYSFLYDGYNGDDEFETAGCVIAVDIADTTLMGSKMLAYQQEGAVDLCIDHHISNKMYAKQTYIDGKASAAALILYQLFKYMNIEIDTQIAKCLYTGIATDTGCFKYENTRPEAHLAGAELMQYDIGFSVINRKMFDVKSKARIIVEQNVVKNMKFFYNDRCSIIVLTTQMINDSGVDSAEFEGLASIPLQIENVQIGITIKQRHENVFKLSVRTTEEIDASAFCKHFNGGGHIRAAGCEIQGTLEDVKKQVIHLVGEQFGE